MTQLKVLQYAQAAAMDKWWLYDGLADKFAGEKAGDMAREMANKVMNAGRKSTAGAADTGESAAAGAPHCRTYRG